MTPKVSPLNPVGESGFFTKKRGTRSHVKSHEIMYRNIDWTISSSKIILYHVKLRRNLPKFLRRNFTWFCILLLFYASLPTISSFFLVSLKTAFSCCCFLAAQTYSPWWVPAKWLREVLNKRGRSHPDKHVVVWQACRFRAGYWLDWG